MMTPAQKLHFMLHSGKNSKWKYYLASYCRTAVPACFLHSRLPHLLEKAARRPDYDYMLARRDYYNRLSEDTPLGPDCPSIAEIERGRQKVYWFDTMRYARYFDPDLRLRLLPGDVVEAAPYPAITKTRPVDGDNANSVLLKLNHVRHFIFVDDKQPFATKADTALFRGRLANKDTRLRFLEMYYGHPMVDAGDVGRRNDAHPEWLRPKLTLAEQMRHKFILTLEGNDIASNLKWVMSPNSIAIMPRPTTESWFMEGSLIPGKHYIEIAPDLSDLPEKLSHYLSHPDECEKILSNAHAYIDQFRDTTRESLISLLVLEKYFRATGQM